LVEAQPVGWLWRAPLAERLETLTVSLSGRRDLWRLQAGARRLGSLRCVTVNLGGSRGGMAIALTLAADGKLTAAEVVDYGSDPGALIDLLKAAPANSFTKVVYRPRMFEALTRTQQRRLEAAARAQCKQVELSVVLPSEDS
jgi:hypothetical protein